MRGSFWDQARCADWNVDAELFHSDGHKETLGKVKRAKAICSGCPIQPPCLQYALDNFPALEGIYGGLTHRERRKLLEDERKKVKV